MIRIYIAKAPDFVRSLLVAMNIEHTLTKGSSWTKTWGHEDCVIVSVLQALSITELEMLRKGCNQESILVETPQQGCFFLDSLGVHKIDTPAILGLVQGLGA